MRRALLLLILTLLPAQCGRAELLTPADVAKLESVYEAKIAPNGKYVAYTKLVPQQPMQGDNGPAHRELHITDRHGNSRPFITGNVSIGHIAWTPVGDVSFLAKRDDDSYQSLYVIPIDGGEARRVLQHDANIVRAAFHPREPRVAFLAKDPEAKKEKEFRDKGFDQEVYEEDWQPTKVWIADIGDSKSAAVKPVALDLPGSASHVAWSPTGEKLVVVIAPTALVDDSYMFKRVVVVDAETRLITTQVKNPGKLGDVAFSPDGKRLAMISAVDIHDPSEGRLMVADLPGEAIRDLMPEYQDCHINSFAWRDNHTLQWVADEGLQTRVGTVDLNGERHEFPETDVILSQLSLSDNGKMCVAVGHTPKHPNEVYWLGEDREPRRITHHNTWLDKIRFANQTAVTWSARDGLDIEGVLVWPLNYEEGRTYPLIMVVHGGPESHVANGWVTRYSYPGQVGAARGFAVFYPNYRGSTGRGVEFSKLGQADAAGAEFDDFVDGMDHLVELGLVDKSRVGITGGSYGGYASAWGATYYSDRFAASVMFVGISDNISKVGTTDIPEEMYLVHHRKRLWDDWDYFLERSPIRHVQKNRTPTLILHGKNDPRVHPSQSLELHRHLKTLQQAPVRLVLYEGEGHGNRKAASRLDYNLRLMRWMEYYLKGPRDKKSADDKPPFRIDYEAVLQ